MEPFTKKNLKLFGTAAERVTSAEAAAIFRELLGLIGDCFDRLEAARPLPVKPDHGDIDIVVLASQGMSFLEFLKQRLQQRLLKFSANGNIKSILYQSDLGKVVHIDLIIATTLDRFTSQVAYYSYGDFSQIVGVMAKSLCFKYGTEGFFKRFQDVQGCWHDLPITSNLMDGLRILGYTEVEARFNAIQDHDDIVFFIIDSPLFDVSFFERNQMRAVDRQAVRKRAGSEYVYKRIRELTTRRYTNDDDFFFRQLFPERYSQIELEKEQINNRIPAQPKKYNGRWLLDRFQLKPGPVVGRLLGKMNEKYGDALDDAAEADVFDFVHGLLSQVSH